MQPDLAVINADVYTSDPDTPRVTAFAVADGRFAAVGSDDEILALAGDDTEIVDVQGAVVTPGLVDGHTHLIGGSRLATGVDLSEIEDKREWVRIIADKAASIPEGSWILGGMWDHNLSDGVLPTRQMLDAVAPNHPILLDDIDGHTAWANSLAIELAGITPDTPAPAGGVIMFEPGTTEMTGIFKEADSLFADAPGMREATDAEAGLRAALKLASSLGITSVHDMSAALGDSKEHDAFLAVLESGDMTVRVWQGYRRGSGASANPEDALRTVAELRERAREQVAETGLELTHGPLFDIGYIKLIVDGVLSTYTALMKEPYSDNPDADPEPLASKEQLTALVRAAHDNGFPVAVHAIGDRGVSWVLDAFAASPGPDGALPDRIEHIEVVTPDDVQRFAELGIIASMQPHHATCCVGNYVIDRIGRDRLPNAYAWRSMLDANIPLVLGSDWPTSPFNPLIQIADTMHRETRIDGVVRPWDENSTLTFEEALHGFTQAGANVTAWSDQIGSITPGKWADFVILDRALSKPIDASIGEASVSATYLAGRPVYEAAP